MAPFECRMPACRLRRGMLRSSSTTQRVFRLSTEWNSNTRLFSFVV
jgi:hypothetical protein